MTLKKFIEMKGMNNEKKRNYQCFPWEYNFEFECDDSKYAELDTFERYFTYKHFALKKKETPAYDYAAQFIEIIEKRFPDIIVDDTDSCPIIHEIYEKLWGWKKKKKKDRYGTLESKADICEFGSDTMNSVQTVLSWTVGKNPGDCYSRNWTMDCWLRGRKYYEDKWKEMSAKDYIDCYHTLGNFVLVPGGFNTRRSQMFNDFWDLSLEYLKENGLSKKKKDSNEAEKEFRWYINFFFLWDYVENKGGSYDVAAYFSIENTDDVKITEKFSYFFKTATRLIERRGKFMAIMLLIEQLDRNVYLEIQKEIFNTKKMFNDFKEVCGEIEKIIGIEKGSKLKDVLRDDSFISAWESLKEDKNKA